MDNKWRPKDWEDFKGKLVANNSNPLLRELASKTLELGASAILTAYWKSDEFGEDASEYCREAGWREPS